MSFIRSLFDNIGKAIGWVADKVTQGLTWTKKVIVDGARWLWDKVKGGASMAKDLAVRSWGWFKNLLVNSKSILIGAWNLTAPFRTWVATPFRLAATASATVGAAWIFSPWFLLVVGGIWIGYLLITSFNNEKETRTKKVPTKTDLVSGEQVRVWTPAQEVAIAEQRMRGHQAGRVAQGQDDRSYEVRVRRQAPPADHAYAGPSRLADRALQAVPGAGGEAQPGASESGGLETINWVWTAVEKGIRDEQKILDDIIDKVVEPEPSQHEPELDLQPVG